MLDHSSRPASNPARIAEDIADLVEALRRQTEHGPARLAADLQRLHGVTVAQATVHSGQGAHRAGRPVRGGTRIHPRPHSGRP
ncbi:hypothetical protein [Nonomuraea helvata]|uniref:Uncharacterized protein n=1 Tax=Nonomuraea helvata TaxID=37484 RepID=A0ABV5S6V4_9ACTN